MPNNNSSVSWLIQRAGFVILIALFHLQLGFSQSKSVAMQSKSSLNSSLIQDRDEDSRSKSGTFATGVVFVDLDNDGRYTDGDRMFAGVRVSNGREIVKTDERGRFRLPIKEGQIVFVIKPSGFRTALDKNQLPKFYYLHKPNGSPRLKFAGSAPTGDLPRSIDFPLYEQQEPEQFRCVLFADPQPRNQKEVEYIAEDVVSELIGSSYAFGVSLGDIAFDDLSVYPTLNESISLIGIPWYNVIGNHDLNLDASSRKFVNETFERVYGPTYYSYDSGNVHFVVLDSIDWIPQTKEQRAHYSPKLGKRQLDWVKNDLAQIPESQMVVLFMHVPIQGIKDCQELYRLIENRPYCISFSGHTHHHEHQFVDESKGWKGKKPHHHVISVTVSGSWWSGVKDERGIPHATMADGAPNGYSILSFDRNGYRVDFKAAGSDDQMGIWMPRSIDSNQVGQTEVSVNVYNGSEKSGVRMKVSGTNQWIEMERRRVIDPHFQKIHDDHKQFNPPLKPNLASPKPSTHVWFAKLPQHLPQGMHVLDVETTDMHKRVFVAKKLFRVKPSSTIPK